MTLENYQKFVAKESKPYMTKPYLIMGITGEAGEVAEWYKKFVLKKNKVKTPLTKKDLPEELGDVLFYVTRLAKLYGYTLKDIMKMNKEKHKEEKVLIEDGSLKCKKHPKYTAQKSPKVPCEACWAQYFNTKGREYFGW